MYVANCASNNLSGPTGHNTDHNNKQQQQQQQQFKRNEYIPVKSPFNTTSNNSNNKNNNNNEDTDFCCGLANGVKVNEVRYPPTQWVTNHGHTTVFFYNNEELLLQENPRIFPHNAKNNTTEQQRVYGTVAVGAGSEIPSNSAAHGCGKSNNYCQMGLENNSSNNKSGSIPSKTTTTTASAGRPATSAIVLGARPYPSSALSSCLNPLSMTHLSPGFETFCTVPGRTSLLSSTAKYRVTIDEVRRRISPPECLNASLLGGILRKAKSKNGGKTLRESLRRVGLSLPAGRRKSAAITAWTALVEEEALHMARDFHAVCHRDFPAKALATFAHARRVAQRPRPIVAGSGADADGLYDHRHHDHQSQQRPEASEVYAERRAMLLHSRALIHELSDVLNMDRSPICGNRPDLLLDPSVQRPLTHFSMMTHGFGGLAFMAVLDALNVYIHESLLCLNEDVRRTSGNDNNNNNNNDNGLSVQKQQAKMPSQQPPPASNVAGVVATTALLPSMMRSTGNPAPF